MVGYNFINYIAAVSILTNCAFEQKAGTSTPNTEMIAINHNSEPVLETATFGGGCFWCTEALFQGLNGVYSVESGYSGGKISNPTYREVASGMTGHAEVVQINFDPQKISYIQLLEIFFKTHDPTTLNRQGADAGTQYRSVIFYHNSNQKIVAEKVKNALINEKIWDKPVVTEITELIAFFKAEDYHQDYFRKNPSQAYCQIVILPKLRKLEKLFGHLLK